MNEKHSKNRALFNWLVNADWQKTTPQDLWKEGLDYQELKDEVFMTKDGFLVGVYFEDGEGVQNYHLHDFSIEGELKSTHFVVNTYET